MLKRRLPLNRKTVIPFVAVFAFAIAAVLLRSESVQPSARNTAEPASATAKPPPSESTLELSSSQLNAIKIEPVGTSLFPVEKEAVGSISFMDDLSVQVFPSFQGKIIKSLVELGDEVRKGQPLYTIESPDLIQAESILIGAAATLDLTNKEQTLTRNALTSVHRFSASSRSIRPGGQMKPLHKADAVPPPDAR